jgi:hypothetical protein
MEAGADAVVLKRAIATDLLPAVARVQGGHAEQTSTDRDRIPGSSPAT